MKKKFAFLSHIRHNVAFRSDNLLATDNVDTNSRYYFSLIGIQ